MKDRHPALWRLVEDTSKVQRMQIMWIGQPARSAVSLSLLGRR